MELSHLTLEELERNLSGLDKTKSPHEALELSNEIGRRKAEQDAPQPVAFSMVNSVQFSARSTLICIIVFLVTCHISPPDTNHLKIVGALGILFAFAIIFTWIQRKYVLEMAITCAVTGAFGHFKHNFVQAIQYLSFFYGVFYAVIFVFKNKLKYIAVDVKLTTPLKKRQ